MKVFSEKYRSKIILLLVSTLILVGINNIYLLMAPATKEGKDCDFVYPVDKTKSVYEVTARIETEFLNLKQKGGVINDASCLNQTKIWGLVEVENDDELKYALEFSKKHNIPFTISGEKHSMGGQSFAQNGLVVSLDRLNDLSYVSESNTVKIGAGARWKDVQRYLDEFGKSLKAVQSINIFSVGGSISVNAHGIAHSPGPIASTIKSMKVLLPSGEIRQITSKSDPELFGLIVGGYGLFGAILEVELEVVDNEAYEWKSTYLDYTEFPDYFQENVKNNSDYGLFYARISISPTSYLTETVAHGFVKTEFDSTDLPLIVEPKLNWLNRVVINFSKTSDFGKWMRWNLEKYIKPKLHNCLTRNQLFNDNEICTVVRNQEMYDSMGYLKNRLKDTDILQEYFVSPENMTAFVDGLREIVQKNDANLLNVTIRVVEKDDISFLNYAKEDMFAFVLYFNQKLDLESSKITEKTTLDLINLVNNLNGTYYLPYQLYYTKTQLKEAYPQIDEFFELKKKYDPSEVFVNKFYEKYK